MDKPNAAMSAKEKEAMEKFDQVAVEVKRELKTARSGGYYSGYADAERISAAHCREQEKRIEELLETLQTISKCEVNDCGRCKESAEYAVKENRREVAQKALKDGGKDEN